MKFGHIANYVRSDDLSFNDIILDIRALRKSWNILHFTLAVFHVPGSP